MNRLLRRFQLRVFQERSAYFVNFDGLWKIRESFKLIAKWLEQRLQFKTLLAIVGAKYEQHRQTSWVTVAPIMRIHRGMATVATK